MLTEQNEIGEIGLSLRDRVRRVIIQVEFRVELLLLLQKKTFEVI